MSDHNVVELQHPVTRSVRRQKLLRLAALGLNAKRAAEVLGLDAQTIRKEYKDPEFKRLALAHLEQAFEGADDALEGEMLSLHERIRIEGDTAFEVLSKLLRDEQQEPAVRARIAFDMLDRNPETQAGSIVRHGALIDTEQLKRAAQGAKEMTLPEVESA